MPPLSGTWVKRLDVRLRFCHQKKSHLEQTNGTGGNLESFEDDCSSPPCSEDGDVSQTSPANQSQVPLFPCLRLPQCDEQWMAANTFFASFVNCANDAQDKYNILRSGIYNYFAGSFGTSQNNTRKAS